jgi:DNA-binding transcriptional LysR family regulator
MEQGPDFRHYESFIAVAEECSFRKAAERLNITQPALSGHIKILEEWLAQDVFKRGPSGSELTEPSRNLLVYLLDYFYSATLASFCSALDMCPRSRRSRSLRQSASRCKFSSSQLDARGIGTMKLRRA